MMDPASGAVPGPPLEPQKHPCRIRPSVDQYPSSRPIASLRFTATQATSVIPRNNFPRLLPPSDPKLDLTAAYPPSLLSQISAIIRGTDVWEYPSEVNLSFIALCNYNLVHLLEQDEMARVHTRLKDISQEELVQLARTAQFGLEDFLDRGGASQRHVQLRRNIALGYGRSAVLASILQSSTTGTPRSQTMISKALERDSRRCMITGAEFFVDVAHIMPYSLANESNPSDPHSIAGAKPNFATFLRLFAGETITSKLESYLLERITSRTSMAWSNINRLENLITLCPHLHSMWDACAITLTPVGDPLSTITEGGVLEGYDVVFEMLPRHKRGDYPDLSEVNGPAVGVRMSEDEDESVRNPPVYDVRQKRQLVSGMVIRLETKDGRRWPLPHPDLLRLHTALARVVRCAGASGERNPDWDLEDFEEEDYECGLYNSAALLENETEMEVDPWVLQRNMKKELGFTMKRYLEDSDWCAEVKGTGEKRARSNPLGTRRREIYRKEIRNVQGSESERLQCQI